MSMRVTESMKFNKALYNLNYLQSANKTIIEQMSSQKKINRPSDDPAGVDKVLNIRHVQQMNEQYLKNIESSDVWLKMTEAKLSDMSDLLVNARELALAQSTGTSTAQARSVAAANVDQLVEQMFSLANSEYMNRYLFAGSRSDQPPFSRNGFDGMTTDLKMALAAGESNGYSGTVSTVIRTIRLANVTAGDALTIEGSTYTAVENGADPDDGQFNVGATDAETADNLRAAIEAVSPGVYTLGGAGTANIAITRNDLADLGAVSTNSRAHFSSYAGSTNKTYALKIIDGGTLAAATYAISADGGRTWGAPQADLDTGIVDLGEGVVMRFTASNVSADDIFSVRASTPGFYDGDGQEVSTDIGQGSPFAYGISGEAVLTDKGDGRVDVFEVMKNLKTALENNDLTGIQDQIDKLKEAFDQVLLNTTILGARMNRMEIARNYQEDYDLRAAEMLSQIEDADIAKLVTDLAATQLGLEAMYKVTAMMTQEMTILNFLE